MAEDAFVGDAESIIAASLSKRLEIDRGAALLYEIRVDNRLEIVVNPKAPVRAQSAFQTDLCVFERIDAKLRIPRVVLEMKASVTTHDLLTYSAKARKHKQIYPYLRYGLVASAVATVPGKFFTHNEALDFMLAGGGTSRAAIARLLRALVKREVQSSRRMESLIFGTKRSRLVRTELH